MNQGSNALPSRLAGDAISAREPQVATSINRLQNALERLHHAADRLEQRTSTVLRPSGPTTPGNPGNRIEKVAEPKAPLSQVLDSLTDRVDGACEHIVDVIDRLEV